MKLNLTTEGKLPDHFWKYVFLIVALGCGINSDSILLMVGV
jgi:hypothetical protein